MFKDWVKKEGKKGKEGNEEEEEEGQEDVKDFGDLIQVLWRRRIGLDEEEASDLSAYSASSGVLRWEREAL